MEQLICNLRYKDSGIPKIAFDCIKKSQYIGKRESSVFHELRIPDLF